MMHRFDPLFFVFGLLFVGVAVIAVFDLPTDLDRWVFPAALIAIGVAVAATTLTADR